MRDFALEVYFSKWEFAAKYNMAGSDRENMTVALRKWFELNQRREVDYSGGRR